MLVVQGRLAIGLALALLVISPSFGIVLRDDVMDEEYIDYATNDLYEAMGLWQAPGVCGWSGATLISPEWAITAAHCVPSSTSTPTFSLGATSQNPELTVLPDDWFRHNAYDSNNLGNGRDFGLIHLSEPILGVTPARLYRGTNGELGKVGTVIGYGRTGDGTTGEQSSLGIGQRRGANNMIDSLGTLIGASANVLVGDFDNPHSPSDSRTGSNVPLPLEGMIALYDSGSGWFAEIDGVNYLVAVTSFRGASDGSFNSDYGDTFGIGRITRNAAWIDANANPAVFWSATSGNWSSASGWDTGAVPTASKTVVVENGAVRLDVAATIDFLFVDREGTLEVNANLSSPDVFVKRGGKLNVGSTTPGNFTLSGNLHQTSGVLDIALNDSGSASLNVAGVAEIAGELTTSFVSGYEGPERGHIGQYTVISADDLQGTFAAVDGVPLGTSLVYAGANAAGVDGLFRSIRYENDEVILTEYLALPGDANGDGAVDGSDFNIWNSNRLTGGSDWSQGDFSGDGFVDASDFNIWNSFRLQSVLLPRGVPEPASWTLLVLGLSLALPRRRV